MSNDLQYMLVIKQGNKDYRPLDWYTLPSYNKEDLMALLVLQKYFDLQKECK